MKQKPEYFSDEATPLSNKGGRARSHNTMPAPQGIWKTKLDQETQERLAELRKKLS